MIRALLVLALAVAAGSQSALSRANDTAESPEDYRVLELRCGTYFLQLASAAMDEAKLMELVSNLDLEPVLPNPHPVFHDCAPIRLEGDQARICLLNVVRVECRSDDDKLEVLITLKYWR